MFELTMEEKTTLWSTLKTERLPYKYGVRVGQPPISQTFYLDLEHVKLCSWSGGTGIIGNPRWVNAIHTTR